MTTPPLALTPTPPMMTPTPPPVALALAMMTPPMMTTPPPPVALALALMTPPMMTPTPLALATMTQKEGPMQAIDRKEPPDVGLQLAMFDPDNEDAEDEDAGTGSRFRRVALVLVGWQPSSH